jgi:histone H3/H4
MLGSTAQGRISGVSPFERSPSPLSDGDPTFQFKFPDPRQSALLQLHREEEPEVDDQGEAAIGEGDIEEDYNTLSENEEAAVLTSTRNVIPTASPDFPATATEPSHNVKSKELKISKHGLPYPSLPSSVVKRIATTFSRNFTGSSKLSKETLLAIEQTSDWFFEQVSEDAAMYSNHAGRRTIDESDVVTLMRRQRLLGKGQTVFSLAQKFLPRELVGEIRVAPTKGQKKRKRMETIAEEDEQQQEKETTA